MPNMNVNWSAVTTDDSGAAITLEGYEVHIDDVLAQTVPHSMTGATINVAPGSHSFKVRAKSLNGVFGAFSVPVVATVPSGVPDAPQDVTATPA